MGEPPSRIATLTGARPHELTVVVPGTTGAAGNSVHGKGLEP